MKGRIGSGILLCAFLVAVVLATSCPVALATKTALPATPNPSASADPTGNLLLNGSFQLGTFADWTLVNSNDTFVEGSGTFGYSDEDADGFFAALGNVGHDSTLSQAFSDTSGASYTFSFWYNANNTGSVSDFSAYFDGTQLLSLGNPTYTAGVWTQYTFTVTGTGSDTISFNSRNDPSWDALDNVSVSGLAPIPEPPTWTLFLLGAALFAAAARFGRKQVGVLS